MQRVSSVRAEQHNLFGDPNAITPERESDRIVSVASQLPGSLYLGTSSWSFPGWEGLVWRAGHDNLTETTLSRKGLPAYSKHPLFRTVGIDRSYYAPLPEAECRAYAEQVPDGFRFVMKADRALVMPELIATRGVPITPNPLLLDPHHAESRVINPALAGFGSKLGAIVFQFPPLGPLRISKLGGPHAFADRLHDFLSSLPVGPEYAIEIRDRGLLTPSYRDALANSGTSHCYAVHPSAPPLDEQSDAIDPASQRVCVLRWMLNPYSGDSFREAKSRYEPFNRVVDPDERSLDQIIRILIRASALARMVVINNKAEGSSPLSAVRLAERFVEQQKTE
ncbi:MAG: DUF72 domain-containing protein [Phycisphaerales bacterium JB050]